MARGGSFTTCPKHDVTIPPNDVCELCLREDPPQRPDTLSLILKRHGTLAEGERPTVLRKMSRTHLPALCRDLGFTKGAEIGVWKGGYSLTLCQAAPKMHMLCVDPWVQHDGWDDGKASSQDKITDAYDLARAVLSGKNVTIERDYSVNAARFVPNGALDFVYIDGNHKHDPVLADLEAWAPKVRSGGIVAGHDFKVFTEKPYIQVVPAVQEYTKAHGIDPWFLTGADKTPSWLWVNV